MTGNLILISGKIYRVTDRVYKELRRLFNYVGEDCDELYELTGDIESGQIGRFIGEVVFDWHP